MNQEPINNPGEAEFSALELTIAGGAAMIRFARPQQRNTLSLAVLAELQRAWATATTDSQEVRAIIFTGTDDVFAAGADLSEIARMTPAQALQLTQIGQNFLNLIAAEERLTIAAVNGFCFGGALDLALACKYRIAAPRAVFAHTGARLGLMTGWGGTFRLPQLIGLTRALEMFVLARPVSATEALEFGLVDALDDDPLAAAQARAHAIPARN